MSDLIAGLEKNYIIEKEIGRGGMGTVYLATDRRLDRQVAIKVLSLSSFNNDKNSNEEIVLRFQREAKAIAKLSHNNIVNIYDIGETDEHYYMVMEFLEGKPLSDLISSKKTLPPSLVISIGIQICNALAFAHSNGITHRDIKPANIILSRKGIAKLTDFGIAQLNKDQAKLTQAGSVLGSIMYISPEQLQDSSKADYRSDIYSLGVTIFELLTGILPFDADSISELFMKILSQAPDLPSKYNKEVPSALDMIISKALLKDVNDRYQNAQDMAKDMSKLLDQEFLATLNMSTLFSINDSVEPNISEYGDTVVTTKGKLTGDFTSTTIRKTMIDKTLIMSLSQSFSWVKNLMNTWKSENITKLSLTQVLNKVMEPSLFGKAFIGTLIIDDYIYAFIYDGSFIGAINTRTNVIGDAVFANLPDNPDSIELRIPSEDQFGATVVLSSIISENGIELHKNLDSFLVNIDSLMDNILSEENPFTGYISCFSDNNIYYYGYDKNKAVFSITANPVSGEIPSIRDLVDKGVIFNAYSAKVVICGPTITNILKEGTFKIKYKNPDQTKLYDIVEKGTEEIPIHLIKESKQNLSIEISFPKREVLNILENEIDLMSVVKETTLYKFSEWMFNEYFYLLNSSGNIVSLKYIYTWIPATEYLKYFETLVGEDGNNYEFSIVLHGEVKGENYKKVLILIRLGDGSRTDMDKFINDTIQVKKKLIKSGDIGGAIYVSANEYPSDTLKLFYERTVEPRKGFGLASLDKLTKYKGFVRIGFGRGFHLNLIESTDSKSFEVIAPLLK